MPPSREPSPNPAAPNSSPSFEWDPRFWDEKRVLVTGGTGTFGRRLVEILRRDASPRRLVVFSRDELKQHEMRSALDDARSATPVEYVIGDIRDRDRLHRMLEEIDVVIHAAALKHVPVCESNPMEGVLTNVIGTHNVVEAALDRRVGRVVAISTDKAVAPANLYGATKLVAEKLVVAANGHPHPDSPRLACVRYGNVLGSSGSVLPLFREQRRRGRLTITDERMTRFWISVDQGARFVLRCAEQMVGGEVFVPKIPSMRIADLAQAVAPEAEIEVTGIRPGEKLHESLISVDEARQTLELDDHYVVTPDQPWWSADAISGGRPMPDGFTYDSETNPSWLRADQVGEGNL